MFVQTTESKAAAAVRISTQLAPRERAELLEGLRPCFARTEPWLQAGKYVPALASGLPRVNGWGIARQAGDKTPDKTQRLLNHASWDTMTAGALDETGQEKQGPPLRASSGSTRGVRAGSPTASIRCT